MYQIRTFNNISDIIRETLTKDAYQISDSAENYDAVLVRSADLHETQFPESLLAIARAGAGTNNVPVDECTEKGIAVFNTPGANANAVKELVICAMLLSCRKVVPGIQWVLDARAKGETGVEKLAEKAKKNYVGPELRGKKFGVLGLGAIGVMVANAASNGLDMEVIGYDPFLGVDAALRLTRSVRVTHDINEIFSQCDYITLHLPLNDETRNTINDEVLAKMKDGAVLINYARGGLVDNQAAIRALKSGKLRAYMTDFAADELIGVENVTITPHLGASTPESEENCADMAAKEISDYLTNGNISHSVNLPDCQLPRSGKCRIAVINRNVKNMVGQMTTVLGGENYNIEHMLNKSRGAYAYTLIDLSETVSDACAEKLKAIDGVLRLRIL